MPAVSERQRVKMAICAHHPSQAYGKCPSHEVAEEFSHKPKGGYRKRRKHRSVGDSYTGKYY